MEVETAEWGRGNTLVHHYVPLVHHFVPLGTFPCVTQLYRPLSCPLLTLARSALPVVHLRVRTCSMPLACPSPVPKGVTPVNKEAPCLGQLARASLFLVPSSHIHQHCPDALRSSIPDTPWPPSPESPGTPLPVWSTSRPAAPHGRCVPSPTGTQCCWRQDDMRRSQCYCSAKRLSADAWGRSLIVCSHPTPSCPSKNDDGVPNFMGWFEKPQKFMRTTRGHLVNNHQLYIILGLTSSTSIWRIGNEPRHSEFREQEDVRSVSQRSTNHVPSLSHSCFAAHVCITNHIHMVMC